MPEVSRPEDEGRRPEVPSATRDYVLRVYPAESEGEVRISDLWRAVLRGKWLVLCAMCSGILLGGGPCVRCSPDVSRGGGSGSGVGRLEWSGHGVIGKAAQRGCGNRGYRSRREQ